MFISIGRLFDVEYRSVPVVQAGNILNFNHCDGCFRQSHMKEHLSACRAESVLYLEGCGQF